MVLSFKCSETQKVFERQPSRRWSSGVQKAASRRLLILHAATDLGTLRVPPGNHLEALRGARKGQHSIRINRQWRICFRWAEGNAYDVEITDYH